MLFALSWNFLPTPMDRRIHSRHVGDCNSFFKRTPGAVCRRKRTPDVKPTQTDRQIYRDRQRDSETGRLLIVTHKLTSVQHNYANDVAMSVWSLCCNRHVLHLKKQAHKCNQCITPVSCAVHPFDKSSMTVIL